MQIRELIAKAIYPEVFKDLEQVEAELKSCSEANEQLREQVADWKSAYYSVSGKLNKMEETLKMMQKSLKGSLVPAEVSFSPVGKVEMGELENLLRAEGFDDIEVADSEYLVVREDDMDALVHTLYKLNIEPKVRYTKSVFDCDDFAELMHMLVAYSIYKAGWSEQVAYGEAWSNLHAFNVAVVMDANGNKKVVFYEPQTGSKVTYRSGIYLPKEAFFTT